MIELENIGPKSVIVIAGPTASGKSKLAIELAKKYNGVVVNADASQIYKGVSVVAACPSEEDKQAVEHELYEILAPETGGSVIEWLNLAVEKIEQIWQQQKLPIVVGGTGFYIESLVKGMSPIPETSTDVKKQVAQMLDKKGVGALFEYLQSVDDKGAKLVNPNDSTRVRRALEIFLDTGKSIAEWFGKPLIKPLPEAEFVMILLLPKLADLEKKCADRFDNMIKNGAVDEVKKLLAKKLDGNLPVMKAIGVRELADFCEGRKTQKEAVDLAKLRTRQYAKRQLTWFRNRLKNMADYVIE